MERRTFIKALAAVTALDCLSRPAFAIERDRWFERVRPLMGTYVSIALYSADSRSAHELISRCFSYLDSCIALISNWDERSQTYKLNVERELRLAADHQILRSMLEQAQRIRECSGGVFNHSVLSLTSLWKEAKAASSVPSHREIARALQQVQSSAVELGSNCARLHGPSGLDFDGIGKGFIADLAGEYLKRQGVQFARVACSGDIRFLGSTEWIVDIQDPRAEGMLGTLRVFGDCGVSTSGDYRNTWFVNGRRYHHLIDPRSGMPGKVCQQSTVVAPSCMLSDALSSACFFLKPQDSSKLLGSFRNAKGVFVSSGHEVFLAKNPNFFTILG